MALTGVLVLSTPILDITFFNSHGNPDQRALPVFTLKILTSGGFGCLKESDRSENCVH